MRTTLTLDDDVARALRERARLLDLPFKQVVNEALGRGLSPSADEGGLPIYRVVPIQRGLAPRIDPLKFNEVNDQLEAVPLGNPALRDNPGH